MAPSPGTDLLSLTPEALESTLSEHFQARGQPRFRVGQVVRWIYERDAESFEVMTDLPEGEREALGEAFSLEEPAADTVARSDDGTVKHLWKLHDGELVESVLIPSGSRLTLCISSQAGCAMGCTFCATGWSGFRRQLTPGEIVAQFRASRRWARANDYPEISNIVYMGMGEPLANRKGVLPSLTILNHGYGVGARRITVSTVGQLPGIEELSRRPEQFRLALSLHAPNSELRQELIPLEKRFPLPDVIAALKDFQDAGGKRVTFEYTMIRDVNDAPGLAEPLAELAREVRAFVNLIPFNPIPWQDWEPSTPARLRHFEEVLTARGVEVAIRTPRGRDIDAACGQLRANALVQVEDRRGELSEG
jgi:23S rRNA (adenine2503-C2)-methyltransferase